MESVCSYSQKPYKLTQDKKGTRRMLCIVGNYVERRDVVNDKAKKGKISLSISSDNELLARVQKLYKAWKKSEKPQILERLKNNLLNTLMHDYALTKEEAIIQGGLEECVLDSSDDEM
ncbi:hypothetical protein R1sor_006211 [Riccia sorocarpa]|uniref:Uncharacterized protein n=1 Tax=Riccia sorocarpa TaxID=122646 RepID=A0ABD3HQL6_9MARC